MNPVKIFLVDDDKVFVFLTTRIIETTDIKSEVKVFVNGEDTIKHLKKIAGSVDELPDIIFLDLNMPVMDGWDFLEEYLQLEPALNKKIKLYLLSSTISSHDIERAKSIGAVSDFFIKPLTKEKVVEVVKNF